MMKFFRVLCALTAMGCAARAQDPVLLTEFPQAAAQPVAGAAVTLNFAGGTTLRLLPVRFEPKPGLSEAFNTHWCGLVIQSAGQPDQALVTVGTGDTEAESCDWLQHAGIGVLPAAGSVQRIGLIYHAGSPNDSGLTPIVLVGDPKSGRWAVDTDAGAALDDSNYSDDTLTLGFLRSFFKNH